jgi:hypothetical protein
LDSDEVRADVQKFEGLMKDNRILEKDEKVIGIINEVFIVDTIQDLEGYIYSEDIIETQVIPLNSVEMYEAVSEYAYMVNVCTKYKTVDKKVKPAAVPLPANNFEKLQKVSKEMILRDSRKIGHKFTKETRRKLQVRQEGFLLPNEDECFRSMLERNGKAFTFSP